MQNRPLVGADSEVWKLGGVGKEGWEKGRKEGCGARPHTPAGGSSPCTRGTSCGRTRPERARQRGRPMEQNSRLSTFFQGCRFGATVWCKTAFIARIGAVFGCALYKDTKRPRGPAAGCAGKTKARRSPALGAFQRGAPEGESEGRQDECKGCWLDRRDQRLRDAVCSLARRLTARERALKPGGAWPLRRGRRAGGGGRPRLAWRSWRAARQITLAFLRRMGYYGVELWG